jgi:soluble lytic murein transglycosylase
MEFKLKLENPIVKAVSEVLVLLSVPFIMAHSTKIAPTDFPIKKGVSAIDEKDRVQFAKQVMGKKEFLKMVEHSKRSITFHGDLESFMLNKIAKNIKGKTKRSDKEIVNAIIRHADKAGFDPLFVMAMIEQESRYNTQAIGRHGEIGLMQVRPPTARWIAKKKGVKFKSDNSLKDPIVNIKIGVLYLQYLGSNFKSVPHRITAYNMGPLNMRKVIRAKQKKMSNTYYAEIFERYMGFYGDIIESSGFVTSASAKSANLSSSFQ